METVYFYRAGSYDSRIEVSGYFTTNLCPTKVFDEAKRKASESLFREVGNIKLINLNPIGGVRNEI